MISPRTNYITLLRLKKDTSVDKTRQVYMTKYNNTQNKKSRDKTSRQQRYSRNCVLNSQKLGEKSRNSLTKIHTISRKSTSKTHSSNQKRLSKQKSTLDIYNQSSSYISKQTHEQQSRKNKEGQNCRLVLKSNGIQKDYFIKVQQISIVRKFLFECCPSAKNFVTLPRQISLQYLLTQQKISGQFLNGQSIYFKPEFELPKHNPNKQITLRDFQIVKQIGAGGFSKVFLCKSKLDNNFYAMKLIEKQMVIKNQKKGIIMNERNIMVQTKHSFIIELKYAFQSQKYIVFVLQYCPGGQLFGLIKKYGRLSQDIAKFYIIQILLGLAYLHSLKVVYRDIKPQNILLGIDGHVKIADLGLAKPDMQSGKLAHSFCGSPQYMSPQMILQIGHTYPVDFYCLGALLYELLTGLPPFYSQDPNQIYEAVLQEQVSFPSQINLSSQCRSLIKSLLYKDPKQRLGSLYGSKEVLAHPWFGKHNYQQFITKKVKPPFVFNTLQKINLDANSNLKNIQNYQKVIKDQKSETKDYKNILKNFYYNYNPEDSKKVPFLAFKNQFTERSQSSIKGRQSQRKNQRSMQKQNSPSQRQRNKKSKRKNLNGLSLQFSLQNFFKK